MGFWSRKKTAGQAVEDPVEAKPGKKTRRLNVNVPFEAKLLVDLSGAYSRRINIKHRLVYQVLKKERIVKVLRMWTHYE